MDGLQLFLSFYPLWLPLFLGGIFWKLWHHYVQSKFFLTLNPILLELKIPRDVHKTPLAMEGFLTALYQTTGESTFIDRLWEGKTRPWFSLEIASIEGQVKFFIWTWAQWKNFIEAQLYAHYPGIEVHEVPDYAKMVVFDKDKYKLWGCDYKLTAPDPYPIKTYIDWGLDDTQMEEENKTDPITSIIETLGSLGKGEQFWIQIMVKAHKDDKKKHGTWFEKVDWQHQAEVEIEKIKNKARKEAGAEFSEMKITSGDKEKIKAIERAVSKNAFDCGIRTIYFAEIPKYRKVYGPILRTIFKPFSSANLNGFKPSRTWSNKYDYPWQD